jgi:hypothetical protein
MRRGKSGIKTPVSDDPFFNLDDPNVDPVSVVDVLKAIPYGKFHILMIFIYFMLFFSTSTLAFNFAFFLMPHAYKCPTVLKHEVIINNGTTVANSLNDNPH